jgi:protocatechuate 4,5-dioxygenase beta chain
MNSGRQKWLIPGTTMFDGDQARKVTRYSIADLVVLTGTQGIELLNWLTTRGALPGEVAKVHTNYHIPISNTASGHLAMESI